MNIDETEKLLAEMRSEIDNLKAHLEAAARAGSMLQQQYLSGEIGNMTSAMAQLETQTKGSESMADIRRKSTVAQKTTAFGFAGDPMDIKKQLHLKHVSADWTVGGSLVVLLRMGHDLTIGTEEARF